MAKVAIFAQYLVDEYNKEHNSWTAPEPCGCALCWDAARLQSLPRLMSGDPVAEAAAREHFLNEFRKEIDERGQRGKSGMES